MKLFVILLLTKTYRHSDSLLTTRHRDAALLPTRFIMGLYTIRRRRWVVWLLDERCGRPTGEDAAAEKRDPNRETETEGGKGGSAGPGGSLGRERACVSSWRGWGGLSHGRRSQRWAGEKRGDSCTKFTDVRNAYRKD
jgi:hypothetical protein